MAVITNIPMITAKLDRKFRMLPGKNPVVLKFFRAKLIPNDPANRTTDIKNMLESLVQLTQSCKDGKSFIICIVLYFMSIFVFCLKLTHAPPISSHSAIVLLVNVISFWSSVVQLQEWQLLVSKCRWSVRIAAKFLKALNIKMNAIKVANSSSVNLQIYLDVKRAME